MWMLLRTLTPSLTLTLTLTATGGAVQAVPI
jgi:hypothetical protein